MIEDSELFSFETKQISGFIVLTPMVRELTYKNSKQFLAHAKSTLDTEKSKAVLCLKNIEIIDSMSLGTLVALLKHVKKLDGEIVITDLAEPLKVLFSLLNFNSVFMCYASVDEAISSLNNE